MSIPSIRELQRERDSIKEKYENLYKDIMKNCVDVIKATNSMTNRTYASFSVPKVIIGYPKYNYKECLLWLIEKLKSEYNVDLVNENKLLIDWSCEIQDESQSSKQKKHYTKVKMENLPKDVMKEAKKLKKNFPRTEIEYLYID